MSLIETHLADIEEQIAVETKALVRSSDWNDFCSRKGVIVGLEKSIGLMRQRLDQMKEAEGKDDE